MGATADKRSDVYSLGITLYEALVGDRPYSGANHLELLYSILNSHPPALHSLRPDIDPDLSAIVSRAIARDPKDRIPDMHALYSEIDDYRSSHSLRVKSSELSEIVAQVEAWDPRSRGETLSGSLVSRGRTSIQDASKPPDSSSENVPSPLPTEPAMAGSGLVSRRAMSPQANAAPAGSAAPRSRKRAVLGAAVGAMAVAIAVFAALSSARRRATSAEPAPSAEATRLVQHPAPTLKVSVPSISLLPELTPPPVVSPAPAPKPPAQRPTLPVAVRPAAPHRADAHPPPRPAKAQEAPLELTRVEAVPRPVQTPIPPPAVAEEGWLNLRTEPWCEVYFRGELVGTTPINRLVFPAGKHSLHLVNKAMGIEKDVVVEVRPGAESTARLRLGE